MTRLRATPEARAALEAWLREAGTLHEAVAAAPGAGTLEGRGPLHVVDAPVGAGRWVVRHYHRGGAVASRLGDRYLRVGEPRPFRELRMGQRLRALGVPTPRHLGAAVYPSGIWYRGDLVTELVPRSRDLAVVLFEARGPDPEAAMTAAGRLIRLLHDRGVVHRDLNLKNILITGAPAAVEDGTEPRALVLDLDRASIRRRVGRAARARMLARFWRSARKWEAATGGSLDAAARPAFEAGYGSRSPASD